MNDTLGQTDDRYKKILESINGIVWEAEPYSMNFIFVNDNISKILGYSAIEWIGTREFWLQHIHEQDREVVETYLKDPTTIDGKVFTYRMQKADGNYIWLRDLVSVVYEDGQPKYLCGLMTDFTNRMRLSLLENLEKQVLTVNAEPRTNIETVLQYYLEGIERIYPVMKCSVLRVAESKVYNWASPSLPQPYVTAINGLTIGPDTGSCGTAAYYGKTVIVEDIATDTKWANYKELALQHNLKACWSHPIFNSAGKVVATFAIYYPFIKAPEEGELSLIKHAAAILRVILENRTYARDIEEMNMMANLGQELANFGTWQWDCNVKRGICSETLSQIFGERKISCHFTFDEYLNRVHPEDKDRVFATIKQAQTSRKEIVYEQRILQPAGHVRVLRSWFKVLLNEKNKPIKYIGACLDITEVRQSEARMRNIAWQQSHVVRAPLARIMGLVTLLKDGLLNSEEEKLNIYDAILHSSNELDGVIKTINYFTEDDL